MAEQIIDGRGNAYALVVNADGSINTTVGGTVTPIAGLNPLTVLLYSGTAIGSIYKIATAGSYVQVLGYDGDNLASISAWSAV